MKGTVDRALEVSSKIRGLGIPTEVYLNEGKLGKMFSYADKLGIPYVTVIGEDELLSGKLTIKDMETGEQIALELNEVIEKISK